MRTTQSLYARYRPPSGAFAPVHPQSSPERDWETMRAALTEMEAMVARSSFADSGIPGQEEILGYALALMRLRESASAVGCARLADACDALAVTVARLIDRRGPGHRDPCAALRHFASHARAMVELEAAGKAPRDACRLPRSGSDTGAARTH